MFKPGFLIFRDCPASENCGQSVQIVDNRKIVVIVTETAVLTEAGQVEGRVGEIVAMLDQPADHPAHRQDAENYEGTCKKQQLM